jgi:hypothetical protein
MRILNLLFCFVFLSTSFGFSQTTFFKYFSGLTYDTGQSAVQLDDSSYAVTGLSGSFGPDAQAFLLKISKTGQYEWSKHYGAYEADWGRRVLYNNALGYFIAGTSNSYSAEGDYDAFLVHTDLQGNELWSKTYGTNNWETINDAVFARDSGIVMVGQSQVLNGGTSDIFVVRTNKIGDTLWTLNYGGTGDDVANALVAVEDSLFVLTGIYFNVDSSMSKGFIMKIHENGSVVYFNQIGDNGNFGMNDISLNMNRLNLCGWKKDLALNEHDNYTGRYNLDGTLFYESVFVNQGDVILDELSLNGSQNKLYVAYRNENLTAATFGMDVTIGRFNINYDWDNGPLYINNAGEEKTEQLLPTLDGGLLAVGYTTYPMNGGSNVFVVKIGPLDQYPITSGVQPIQALVGIEQQEVNIENSIFPVPCTTSLNFKGILAQYEYVLWNSQGQNLGPVYLIENKLDVNSLMNGLYFLSSDSLNKPLRFIKQ